MDREQIFLEVKAYMVTLFDVSPEAINLNSDLQSDLDLDSIDAVDLIVKVQELIGQKIKPEVFKTVHTVGDVVDRIYDLVHAEAN